MKISVHGGMTFQVGNPGSNQYARVDVTFDDIDPKLPLEPQIEGGKQAARAAWAAVSAEVSRQAEETYARGAPTGSRRPRRS